MTLIDKQRILAEAAGGQWGFITTAQASRLGVERYHLSRMSAAGAIQPVIQGVYKITDLGLEREDVYVTWLAHDPRRFQHERRKDAASLQLVASHKTAAELLEIGEFFAETPEFTYFKRVRTTVTAQYHRALLHQDSIQWLDGLPVTTFPRTIVDLWQSGVEDEFLAKMLYEYDQRGLYQSASLVNEFVRERVARSRTPHGETAVQYPDSYIRAAQSLVDRLELRAGLDTRTQLENLAHGVLARVTAESQRNNKPAGGQ